MNLEAFASRFFFYAFIVGVGIRSISPASPNPKSCIGFFSLSVTNALALVCSTPLYAYMPKAATSVAAFGLVFSFHIRRDPYSPSAHPPYAKSEAFCRCFSSAVGNGLNRSEILPCCLTSIFGCKCLRTLVGGAICTLSATDYFLV